MMTLAKTIIYGTSADVERAIAQGANVAEMDEYGFNPMIEAAIMKKLDVAKILIRHKPPVDLPDITGRTALHWASDNHDMELCRLLLENGANANAYSNIGQPVLAYPYLRQQTDLKNLLYQYGASLTFIQDYINAKLLGHRFELEGQTHIINPKGDFILVDFEGFMFEFTSSLIQDSLHRFSTNYAAKHLMGYFSKVEEIIRILSHASELIKYQQFSIKIEQHEHKIDQLLDQEILLIPIVYTGHAITGVKYQDIFIKCDRGEYGRNHHTCIIYKIHKPKQFNKALIKQILYKRNPEKFIHYGLNELVGLEEIYTLPLPPQISGNCSWANVEAAVPAILFLLFLKDIGTVNKKDLHQIEKYSLDFFNQWHEWDQDRALDECIQSFYNADTKRKASKVQILAAILVHRCNYKNTKDLHRAEKILPILRTPEYEYILQAYIKEYTRDKQNPVGQNLLHILDMVTTD